MKCKCGVELFHRDIVEFIYNEEVHSNVPYKYRCPKCFKVTKVK